jgi:hypothetical protein
MPGGKSHLGCPVEYPLNAHNGTQEPLNITTPGNPTPPKKEKSSWFKRFLKMIGL